MAAPDENVDHAQSHIHETIATIKTPRDVAVALGVPYETLRKQFRREMGVPLGQYIQQVRIDRARRLLVETDEPVYVICGQVGFASDSSGIRVFKRATGLTMGQYRRRYANGSSTG